MIETTNSNIVYIADGIQTEFEYPYPFVKDDDINLYITVSGVRTKISKDSFSFNATTKKVTYPLSGDPVTSGSYVEITRETALTQLEDSSIVAFKSNDVERIADKLTMICQDTQQMVTDAIAPEGGQIQEAIAEAIGVHDNSASAHPLKEDKANKVTAISDSSTDTQYPSAKVVNTELNKKQPKALSESITINGAVITTVEGALKAINENSSIANTSLSNLTSSGENHFVQLQSGVAQADVDYVVESYSSGTSWYRVYKSGWCEQGGVVSVAQDPTGADVALLKQYGTTDYTLSISLNTLASAWSSEANPRAIQGIGQFHIQSGSNTSPSNMSWVAQGYIIS